MASELLNGLHNEVILIKGSRAFNFDLVSDALELKVMRRYRSESGCYGSQLESLSCHAPAGNKNGLHGKSFCLWSRLL